MIGGFLLLLVTLLAVAAGLRIVWPAHEPLPRTEPLEVCTDLSADRARRLLGVLDGPHRNDR